MPEKPGPTAGTDSVTTTGGGPQSNGHPGTEPVAAAVNPYRPRPAGPSDFAISLGEKGGSDRQLLRPANAARQSMRGFDPKYVDIIDYIVRITHRIWEEKEIGYIYDTYRHNSRVTDDSGLQYGRDKIVADTVQTINAFPDIRLYADEIVWAGDDVGGFHTSHRTVILGTNTGYSRYGPPTGRRIAVWCIANCVALENEIFEEHVLYNNSSMLGQLGFDLKAAQGRSATPHRVVGREIDSRSGRPNGHRGQGKPVRMAPGAQQPVRGRDYAAVRIPRGLELAEPQSSGHVLRAKRDVPRADRVGSPPARVRSSRSCCRCSPCSRICALRSTTFTAWATMRMAT